MKKIQTITIWKNGESKEAKYLSARIINDDLNSSCTFYWTLNEEQVTLADPSVEGSVDQVGIGSVLAEGNSTMSGDDYQNWDGTNDVAYYYIANTINVTITE